MNQFLCVKGDENRGPVYFAGYIQAMSFDDVAAELEQRNAGVRDDNKIVRCVGVTKEPL